MSTDDQKTAIALGSEPAIKTAATGVAPSIVVGDIEGGLSAEKKTALDEIRALALELSNKIHAISADGSRELTVARSKVVEVIHWVEQHFAK